MNYFRDGGGGRRRGTARWMASAFCLLLLTTMIAGCDLQDPVSPNTASDLTGQTTNQTFTFNGTITVTTTSSTLVANDQSTVGVVAEVRDSSGNPINNLTTVTFTSNLGAFVIGVDDDGNNIVAASATGATFNGVASAQLTSTSGQTGVATVVASIGTTTGNANVTLEPAPLAGNLSMAFGTSGTGSATLSGVATPTAPLDASVGVTATALDGAPLAGATVRFRVVSDTTDEGTGNDPATWLAPSSAITGGTGSALNILRAYGPGVIVLEGELIDTNTGQIAAVSNRIILTTQQTFLATLSFAAGGANFAGAAPYTTGISALITDTGGSPQQGLTVRFSITNDTTDLGASLSSSTVVTDAAGLANSSITVPDNASGAGSTVSILAEVIDSAGTVLATSNVIVATGS